MKVRLIAVGRKMPAWVEDGVNEYRKRLPKNFELSVTEIPLAKRSKGNMDVNRLRSEEGRALLGSLSGKEYVVALDEKGKSLATESMAAKVRQIMEDGRDLVLLAGGPDGLSDECRKKADEIWSLSALTMPHTIVRIVVAEQVYRVWSVMEGHPYHRE